MQCPYHPPRRSAHPHEIDDLWTDSVGPMRSFAVSPPRSDKFLPRASTSRVNNFAKPACADFMVSTRPPSTSSEAHSEGEEQHQRVGHDETLDGPSLRV
jgi:hypothetical protein